MIKCPNCGTENDESTMFCENCGTKIPHEKECPGCHAKVKLTAKFCGECGYNFSAQQSTSAADKGMSVGDKNVIAGDVIGKQETFKIAGAATIVKNEDETKKMVKCHVCGHNIAILQSIDCPVCHEITCENCYDASKNMCAECINKKNTDKEEVYTQALRKALEDGKITLEERQELNALQKELGIAAARAFELEKLIKNGAVAAKNTSVLSSYVKFSLENALDIFYEQGDVQKAYELLKPIYERYPQNEEVLTSFLYATIQINPDEALQIIQQNLADVIGIHLVCIDYDLMRHDLDSADERLTVAMQLWPDNLLLGCRKALCLKAMYDELQKDLLLQQAVEILSALPQPQNKLESSWFCKTQFTIYHAMGDEIPEIDKEYCTKHNLYYALSCPDILRKEKKTKTGDSEKGSIPSEGKKSPDVTAKRADEDRTSTGTIAASSSPVDSQSPVDKKTASEGHSLKLRIPSSSTSKREKETESSKSPAEIYQLALSNKERDKDLYLKQLRNAAEAGYAPAQYDMMVEQPERNDEEKKIAASWCIKAAEQGYAKAQATLGCRFEYGKGVELDKNEAVKWYRKAAEQGYALGQVYLAQSYMKGSGVLQDKEAGHQWYLKAAEQGQPNAQEAVSADYAMGRGVSKDCSEAVKWARKAAEKNHKNSQYQLGMYYANGNGVPQNYEEAIKWITKAAEQGYALAQYTLGDAYYNCKMGLNDTDIAKKWLMKSAEQGYATAMFELGFAYMIGSWNLPKDYIQGEKWLIKAAEAGNKDAQYQLAKFYEDGDCLKKDLDQAKKWYKKASEQGSGDASFHLAGLYPNDKKEAYKWLCIAAEQGNPYAKSVFEKRKK